MRRVEKEGRDTVTSKQAAAVLQRSEHVVRRFAASNGVLTRASRLGDGRQKHYITADLIEKLRSKGYTEEATRLEEWHQITGTQPS